MKLVGYLTTTLLCLAVSLQAELVNHWQMNEGSGFSTVDVGTGGNTGVFMQGANPASSSGQGPTWVSGDSIRGTALNFDGDDWILTDSQGVLNSTPRTVSAWVKMTAESNRHTLVEWGNNAASSQYFRFLIENGRLRFEVAGGNALALTAGELVIDQWYHVVLAIDDFNNDGAVRTPEVKFYLDGAEVPQTGGANQLVNTAFVDNDYVRLGGGDSFQASDLPREPLTGLMDDVRIYDNALSDLEIANLVNVKAWAPSPANNAVHQGVIDGDKVSVDFSWNVAVNPADESQANPGITKHYFYISVDEPNFIDVVPQELSSNTNSLSLEFDKNYYWRVDESVNNSAPTDSATIEGPVWMFSSLPSIPVIISQPEHNSAFVGDPDVSLSVEVSSLTTPHYQWYKSIDNNNDPLSADDSTVGIDSPVLSLMPEVANECYYYCVVSNASGTEVASEPAYLTINRMVLYWDMETSKFMDMSNNGNDAIDESVKVDPADPNITFPSLSDDIPGAIGSHSAEFVVESNGDYDRLTAPLDIDLDGDPETVEPKIFYAGYTLAFWVKAETENQGQYTGIFNNNDGGSDFQIDFSIDRQYRYWGSEGMIIGLASSTDWVYITVVCDGSSTEVYYNLDGIVKVQSSVADIDFGQFQVGCNRNGQERFSGLIDDVKVWNYPVPFEILAEDYYSVVGMPACKTQPEMDFDGNCMVNVADFAQFAIDWLSCNLYPQQACN